MASEPLPEKQNQTLKVHKGQTASQGDDSNDRESVVNHLRQELYASFEAGPLLSPEKLAAYDKVLQGVRGAWKGRGATDELMALTRGED